MIASEVPSMVVFEKQGLKITFKLERSQDNPDLLVINMVAVNSGLSPVTDFLFQAAVPKVNRFKLIIFRKILNKILLLYYFL